MAANASLGFSSGSKRRFEFRVGGPIDLLYKKLHNTIYD